MAEHNIFMGGNRTRTSFPPSLFPQRDVNPDQVFEADNRRGPIDFSLTRRLVWKCHASINKACPDDAFSDGLAQYVECLETPIASGDVLNTNILPRFSSLREVWVNVVTPAAGMTGVLRVRGNAASVGGPVDIATVDFGVAGSQLITLPDPIYFDQNDMFQVELDGVVTEELLCSEIMISPVVREYCRGFN